jgi:hypothetical protein
MVFNRPKPNICESSSHFWQVKYNNIQTKWFKTKNLSIYSRNTEILSKSRTVYLQRNHHLQKCASVIPSKDSDSIDTFTNTSDSKKYSEVCEN